MKGNTFSTNKHSNEPSTDLMASSKNIDYSLIIQSIPSLLISLIGLALSGKILDMEQNKKYAETFPLLLLSNCILSFKGNTELIYAMYLSSSTQLKDHSTKTYLRFSFDNGCLLLLQSVIIGVSVGLLGLARNVIGNIGDKDTVPKMLAVCMLSSLFSTMIIMTLLIPSVLFALEIGINPDNIVLPVIASVGDFIDITVLIMFIKKFQFAPNIACYLPIILILAITPVLVYYSVKSERMIPIQSMHVLIITYLFSTLSSYSIQIFSKRHKVLASSYPLFCGLTGASAYVYLNKKITSMQNSIPHNKERCFYSIIVASIIVAFFATLLMPILGIYFRRSYSILFVTGFVMTVGVLLKVIDLMMKLCKEKIEMAGVIGLPVIASVADLLSSLVVLSICFMVYGI